MATGVHHIGGTAADVDRIVGQASAHGWRALYADRYPYAGGRDHHAAYFENDEGFTVEVVAAAAL
ncbi:hypothetical protein E3T55_19985 [Cryobacterium frigoriphilum]|uniref:VOC domain-containing protein n=1 Tax=Cryobacterium frigoriphilum TaxID=1259150 RepID=A0A4R8ZTA3_9MICO|nr:hypothetical protein [Cryobacterium frigoriphilum]TFD44842.1 hypothetical protein E3T55_19985 [Cryobacterium frigoriphilum]